LAAKSTSCTQNAGDEPIKQDISQTEKSAFQQQKRMTRNSLATSLQKKLKAKKNA
jgi:hypothetical protein